MITDGATDLKDCTGLDLFIGDEVVFSRPNNYSQKGGSRLGLATIVKYNGMSGFITLRLKSPVKGPWEKELFGTPAHDGKFYKVDRPI